MKYWTTKEGQRLRPNEMTSDHLMNTIEMLTLGDDTFGFEFTDDPEILELLIDEAEYRGLR